MYEEAQDESHNHSHGSMNLNKVRLESAPSSTIVVLERSPSASGTFIVEKSPTSDVLSNARPISILDKLKQRSYYMSPMKSKIANFEKLTSNSKIPLTPSRRKKLQTAVSSTVQEASKQLLSSKTTPNSTVRCAPLTNSPQKRIDYEEARGKKAATLQTRAEEDRLRREEKRLRAQRIRENQELEKRQALVEAKGQKRQKLEDRLLELQQQRRKMKAKDLELKRKAAIDKIESRKGTRDHVQKMENERPIYMIQTPPPLSTSNYVPDDDEPRNRQVDKLHIEELLEELPFIPRQIVNTALFLKPITPDLVQMLPSIKKTKLQRNSIEAGLSEHDEENYS